MFRDRREFVQLGLGIFAALSLPLALRRRFTLVRRTIPLMGTIAELQVVDRDERLGEAAIDAALAELLWVERRMTRFRPDSDIGRANLSAAREAVPVHPATAAVVAAALRWAEASEGAFDPGIGAAVGSRRWRAGCSDWPGGGSGAKWWWKLRLTKRCSATTIRTCNSTWAASRRGMGSIARPKRSAPGGSGTRSSPWGEI